MSATATIESPSVSSSDETTVAVSAPLDFSERMARNQDLVRNHALTAAGIGLIPLPAVDFVALTALQVNLLRKLSSYYDVPFTEEIGKKVVGALIAGYAPVAFAMPVASLLKAIPLIGQTTGALAASAIAGASTYATGKVFIQHFESGGTFLNFDPVAVREYYREQFQEGREVVGKDAKKG